MRRPSTRNPGGQKDIDIPKERQELQANHSRAFKRFIFPFSCLWQVPSGPKEIRMPEELKGDIEVPEHKPELTCLSEAPPTHASTSFHPT